MEIIPNPPLNCIHALKNKRKWNKNTRNKWYNVRKAFSIFIVIVHIMTLMMMVLTFWASQVVLVIKNPPANAGDIRDTGLISGSGRSPGRGHSDSLQYSCLRNSIDRGA